MYNPRQRCVICGELAYLLLEISGVFNRASQWCIFQSARLNRCGHGGAANA
jgi:hypothetical protein